MAKTWSNAKKTDHLSAAQKARNRPSNLTAFLVLIVFVAVFFLGLMAFVTIYAERHPPTEQAQPIGSQPKED